MKECGNSKTQLDPHFYILIINRMIVFFTGCFNRGYPKDTCQIMFQKAPI